MNHRLDPTCSLLLVLTVFVAPAVSQRDTPKSVPARQWQVVDLRFEAEVESSPFDVDFSATFTSETGMTLDVPGFFDGQSQYAIRFTPASAGVWTYVTQSEVAALHGKRGEVRASAPGEGRHGGIVLDPKNRRNFQFENGRNYYPIAFECDWLFALDAENRDDIPVTRTFVDTLVSNGFNQIVMNVYAYDVPWPKDGRLPPSHEYGSPRVFPFGGNNAQPDHRTLNVDFFKRLDRVIDYLDRQGIAAHLMIYVWNKQVNWPAANSEEDNRYFDYVVRRYQAYPNVIWDVSKEALGYGHTDVNYISDRIDRLRKLDAYQRLITVHDYGYCKQFSDKVDFISVQIWASELYGVMRKICSELPDQPILNIEHGGYERSPYVVFPGSYTSPEVCLERAYQCVFAGTYPTHYWQAAAWNAIIPDIEAMQPEDRPRLEYYRHMREFVEQYGVANLTPSDKHSNSGFCLHNRNDLLVYYVPKENVSIGVRVPKESTAHTMTGVWFDPFDGTYSAPIDQAVTQWPSFDKPAGDRFAILIVRLAS